MSVNDDVGGGTAAMPEGPKKITSVLDIMIGGEVLTDGFVYDSPEVIREMHEIVSVWKQIHAFRVYSQHSFVNMDADAVAQSVKELLAQWHVSGDFLKIAVAVMESLPPQVVQRALEYYNIDYVSMESFLRRIRVDQIEGLYLTYRAIEKGEIPDCYAKGLANRIDKFRRPEAHTFEAIQADRAGLGDRYMTRNARVTNILGLGFGYHKYPKLTNDRAESPSTIQQARNLVSLDHQVSVNRLYGIYAFLYAMLPVPRNREVGSWFCPGFHATLWGWVAILIGSPVALYFGIMALGQSPLSVSIPLLIFGAVLPITMFYASMWCLFTRVVRKEKRDAWLKSFAEYSRQNYDADYWRHVAFSVITAVGVALAFSTALAVSFGIYLWFGGNVILSTTYATFIFFWMMQMGKSENRFTPCAPWEMKGFRIIGTALTLFLVLRGGCDLILFLRHFPFEHIGVFLFVIGTVLTVLAFVCLSGASLKKANTFQNNAFRGKCKVNVIVLQKQKLHMQRFYWALPEVLLLCSAVYLGRTDYLSAIFSTFVGVWLCIGLAVTGVVCVFTHATLGQFQSIDVAHVQRARWFIRASSNMRKANEDEIAIRMLEKEGWFSRLTPVVRQLIAAQRLDRIIEDIFDGKIGNVPASFWSMSGSSYGDIQKVYNGDSDCLDDVYCDRDNRRRLSLLILEGNTLKEAVALLKKKEARHEARKVIMTACISRVSRPFLGFFEVLVEAACSAWSFLRDIARRCPSVSLSARAK